MYLELKLVIAKAITAYHVEDWGSALRQLSAK
jgi:hypothetical protein